MASILKVDTIQDQDGNNIINESGDTITIGASGDTVNIVGTLQNGGTNFLQGITMADSWRLTADTNQGTNADVTTNWERVDTDGYGGIGTGLTESSGIFSFPSTGIYLITAIGNLTVNADGAAILQLYTTLDNSTYNVAASNNGGSIDATNVRASITIQFIFDVTNITTHKFKFATSSFGANTLLRGVTDETETGFTVIRLGDT